MKDKKKDSKKAKIKDLPAGKKAKAVKGGPIYVKGLKL